MKEGNRLPMKDKIDRLKKIKNNLESSDFTNISKAAKCLNDSTSVGCLGENGMGLTKQVDGIHHWVSGPVTKKMAEKFYDLVNQKREESRKKSKAKKEKVIGVPYPKSSKAKPSEQDPHIDLAEEISKAVSAAVKKELEPLITAMQCSQRHLDVIATKINIDLS